MSSRPREFDPVRRKHVSDAPEERVRQAFLRYLMQVVGVPRGLIAVEKAVRGGSRSGRTDIVVHDRTGSAWMVVECKAPSVAVDQSVMNQAVAYNRALGAPYVLVTNGTTHLCAHITDTGSIDFLESLPPFPQT